MAQWYPTREILRFGRVWSQKRRQSSTQQVPCVQCGCGCVGVGVCVSVQCGRGAQVMVQNLSLVDNTGKITKGLLFYRHKTNNLDTFCSEINFPDNKIQRIKPWTFKTLVALKIFVRKKARKIGYHYVLLHWIRDLPSALPFSPGFRQVQHQYNLHQVNNTIGQYYFWKLLQKHFRNS